jgi:hypothetical protein
LAKKSAKSAAKEAANDIMSEWYEEEKGMVIRISIFFDFPMIYDKYEIFRESLMLFTPYTV